MSNLPSRGDVDLVVFDILGTLVNEPGGLRASIGELAPSDSSGDVDDLVEVWQGYVADQQQKMLDGSRSYANSDVIDREAAELVATRRGVTDPAAIDRLAAAERPYVRRPVGDPPLATDSFDHNAASLADRVAAITNRP